MAKKLTWRKAIDKVLAGAATPPHYNEITERIIANHLRSSLGATPSATVNAQISSSIKHDGSASPYVRVARGTFTLSKAASASAGAAKDKLTPEVEESAYSGAKWTPFPIQTGHRFRLKADIQIRRRLDA